MHPIQADVGRKHRMEVQLTFHEAAGWRMVGTGDFSLDGRDDIVWRHTSGENTIWFMIGGTVLGLVAGLQDCNGELCGVGVAVGVMWGMLGLTGWRRRQCS